MAKKREDKQNNKSDTNLDKIWCPRKEFFQYISVCLSTCKLREKCSAIKEYLEPRLF